jgi:archaellum component FlaF (FlaF/FlaG flagellin family)
MISVVLTLALILFIGIVPSSFAQSQQVDSLFNKAQTLERGIYGISNVPNVKITGVTISSDKAISISLIYNGTETTSPPIIIVANGLTNRTEQAPMEGSQVLSEGWISPSSLTISVNGSSSLYDVNLVSVVVTPYGSTALQK